MLHSQKADVFLQLVFTILAVVVASVVGSVVWIKGFNAHLKSMEDGVKESTMDDTLHIQQPIGIVRGETRPACECGPYQPSWRCGDSTDCEPNQRVWVRVCTPLGCKDEEDLKQCVEDQEGCCGGFEDYCSNFDCCGVAVMHNYPELLGEVGIPAGGRCPEFHRLQVAECPQWNHKVYRCVLDPQCQMMHCSENPTATSEWCISPDGHTDLPAPPAPYPSSYVEDGGCDPGPVVWDTGPYCEIECQDPFNVIPTGCGCTGDFELHGGLCRCEDGSLLHRHSISTINPQHCPNRQVFRAQGIGFPQCDGSRRFVVGFDPN